MYFQTLDDKKECVGVYSNGHLNFDEIPSGLTKTWKYTGSIDKDDIEYAWLLCGGKELSEVCPRGLSDQLLSSQKKFNAFMKAFRTANVDLRQNCIFDLVPYDFLKEFCEIKNRITEHVFENYSQPTNYEFLKDAYKLIHKIRYQDLNVDVSGCRDLFLNSQDSRKVSSILNGSRFIDCNLFGTATGRLSTKRGSFPILTMKKKFRKLVKPKNDWFISLDYNSAEVRTLLALSERPQPEIDIHDWHCETVFKHVPELTRQKAKTMFFAWLYNPASKKANIDFYDREKLLKDYYKDGIISTPLGRDIRVVKNKAFNYLIQSTTADLVIDRAIQIDKALEGKQSFISHIIHDEIVIDFSDKERYLLKDIKNLFANNTLDEYVVNIKAGQNYYELKDMNI